VEIETLSQIYPNYTSQDVQTLYWVSFTLVHLLPRDSYADANDRGLAWHTDENALRQKFEEFGAVEEAVSTLEFATSEAQCTNSYGKRLLSRIVTLDVAVVLVLSATGKNPMLKPRSLP
jgi:hypothetical protein